MSVGTVASGTISNVSRRAFVFGVGTSGLMLALAPGILDAQEAKKYGGDAIPGSTRDDPRVFVAIAQDGAVTIVCHRSEMGQGVRTSIAMVIADELEADWGRVQVVQAPGDEARYGSQNTIASRSLRHGFAPLRRAGAAARTMLEAAAAASWDVPMSEVKAQNHGVVHVPTARRLDYGALAQKASEQRVPPVAELKLKQPAEFRYIGQGQTKPIDDVDIVTLLGGGFGRKSRPDFVVEAALVSRTLAGKPVKLTWTREDDLVNDYFHTVSVEHLEAGLDESRKTVAWLHRTVAPTIASLGSPPGAAPCQRAKASASLRTVAS